MKKGISLIVLIITIIVIIILAGTIIFNLSNNNPIDSAKIASVLQTKDNVESTLQVHVTSIIANTLGKYSLEDIITGKTNELEAIVDVNDKIILNGSVLYRIDIDKIKNNTGINIPKTSNNEKIKWYVEITSGKFYLVYDSTDYYENWLGTYNTETGKLDNATLSNFIIIRPATQIILDPNVVDVNGLKFNRPDVSNLQVSTTKAIKWDASNNESQIDITIAKDDTSWYDYSNKKWANILTSNNGNNAYWVWIPRYAYKIDNPHSSTSEKINIIFLAGISNKCADGSELPSGYIIHPAFTFGDKQLKGIWVAKYEASSSNPNRRESTGTYAGAYTGGGDDTSLQVRVLPNIYSWRNIATGNMQTVCMNMTNNQGTIGTNLNLDTHQMKNIEWGAIAYLSQSIYGEEPWINPYGDTIKTSMKLKTGYAGNTKNSSGLAEGSSGLWSYNTENGIKASTTGNIYGVYDMSGGSWEQTAALINNGNVDIDLYGKAEHIENYKIKTEYAKYYDIYEPGDEEKEGAQFYGMVGEDLWNSYPPFDQNEYDNNVIRKRITNATYSKLASRKGDALYETSNTNSYYGKYTSTPSDWEWLIDTQRDLDSHGQYATGWNDDFMLIGYSNICWFARGDCYYNDSGAGVFASDAFRGYKSPTNSFRPVLVSM